jgi:hypothetical protein
MKVDTWPKKNEPVEIHYFAQLAALNDCLYRNMYVSKYVVFQDLDEFIIPRKQLTWTDMLQNLPKGHAAYMFRCYIMDTNSVYFCRINNIFSTMCFSENCRFSALL